MRHHPVLFFTALAVFIGACHTSKNLTAPAVTLSLPDTLPALPPGEIRQLKLIGLLAGEKDLQAQLFIQAELSLTSSGLPK
jgi:hypothetical protein